MIRVFIILLIFCTSARATVHYVTFNGAGSANGTTIGNAFSWSDFLTAGNWDSNANTENNKIGPGETVYFSGNFPIASSPSSVPGAGSSGNKIILDGDDGVNTAANFYATSSGFDNLLYFYTGDNYFEVRDFTFSDTEWMTNVIRIRYPDYIDVHDCTFNVDAYKAIYILNDATNINIYNNSITWEGTDGNNSVDAIYITGGSNINIYGNTLKSWQHGGVTINTQTSTSNSDIAIYENYYDVEDRPYGRFFTINAEHSGQTTSNISIYNNWIESQRTSSQLKGCNNVYIYYNVFNEALNMCRSTSEYGCTSEKTDFTNNQYGTGHHLDLKSQYKALTNTLVYNNVFGFSNEAGVKIMTYDGNITVNLSNNIFYDNANCDAGVNAPFCSVSTAYDRIFYHRDTSGGTYDPYNMVFENNLLYETVGTTNDIRWDGNNYATIANFESGSPTGIIIKQNNDTDNPDFTDAANSDYTLTYQSPAINAGKNLGSSYDDAWSPTTSLPPNSVTTVDQDSMGAGWEMGVFVSGSTRQFRRIFNILAKKE